MLRFIATRLVKSVFILLAILVLNFLLIHAAPGYPAAVMAGEAGAADAKFLADLRERFGLDRPLDFQLWVYLSDAVRLDLGFSYRQQMPVAGLIRDRLPATLLLTGTAFVMSLVLGVMAGVAASARQGSWRDSAISTLALLFYATPLFWVALMASLVFSVWLGWLPAFGYETIGAGHTGLARAADIGAHLVLPATTLGLFFMAVYTRMTRASMLEVSRLDFVKTARAKGLRPGVIQRRHVLRNALLPVITLAGLQAGQIFGGAILTETLASLMVATAILLESSLSFLGLGDPNVMSWGYMIGAARTVIRTAWWLSFIPGMAIVLTVLALNLIGEGLNDALNPRLRRRPE